MTEALAFSAVTKIVSSAVGLVCNKVYDSVTNQFKDGDVAKESVHEIIVRDLNGIKSTLDCLSLKDLDASYSFLKEGIQFLNLTIADSPGEDGNECPPGEANSILKDSASDILNEASSLRKAIEGLSISSKERFLSAKGRFGDSRKEATRAFNNKSLSTENRIMACKLRVAAIILESGLEDPQAAVAACLESLKELHGVPGIQDRCSVFLKGGFFTSRYKAEERLEHIMSVLSINHALFDFASKHSSEYPNVFTWPGIELKDRKVNPILHAIEILEKTSSGEEVSRQLGRIGISKTRFFLFTDFAVNSRGEIALLYYDQIMVIKSTGECKDVGFCKAAESVVVSCRAIAIDSNDDLYVVSCVLAQDSRTEVNLVLYIFDENYNLRYETNLDFLRADRFMSVRIAVDKNKNIIMIQSYDNHVYICDSRGQLKFKFERDSSEMAYSLSTTSNNDIMIPSDDGRSVHVYTTEGNLKSTNETPKGHRIKEVAFHHGISAMIVLTYVEETKQSFLLCYSETGELENLEVFCDLELWDVKGHPSGPFAVPDANNYLVYL